MKYFRLLYLLLLLVSVVHGLSVLWRYHDDRWQPADYNRPLTLEGTVASLPEQKYAMSEFLLQTSRGLVLLNWYYPYPALMPGMRLLLTAKFKSPTYLGNDGEFNYDQYLKQQEILARGYVLAKPEASILETNPWKMPFESFRFYVYQKILRATQGLPMQGVLIALTLGNKTLLNPNQWQVFSDSGTSYFMVISGLHIVLFAMLIGFAVRYAWSMFPRAALFFPAPKVGLIAGLIFGLIYSLLAGFTIPTQRALWMLLLMGIARLFAQRISVMALLLWACLLIVAWNPFSMISVAFLLSFTAVFFLIYTLSARYGKPSKLHHWLYPQWVMYIALMPVLVYFFHSFAIISLFTNFITIPFMLLAVIPLALSGTMFLFIIPKLGHLLLLGSNAAMLLLWPILKWSVALPHAVILLPQPSIGMVCLSMIGLILLFAPRGTPLRFAGVLLLLPLFFPKFALYPNAVKVKNLTLTEGKVTLFQTKNAVLIEQDIQHLRAAHSAMIDVIAPYLAREGLTHVNVWVINGSKNAHALRSLENTWKNVKVDRMIIPKALPAFDTLVTPCTSPQVFEFNQIKFTIALQNSQCAIEFVKNATS